MGRHSWLVCCFQDNGQTFPAHLTLAPLLAARSLGFTFFSIYLYSFLIIYRRHFYFVIKKKPTTICPGFFVCLFVWFWGFCLFFVKASIL